jgi:hypothetical protein
LWSLTGGYNPCLWGFHAAKRRRLGVPPYFFNSENAACTFFDSR